MKYLKIIIISVFLFGSCISVDHKTRKMNAEGLAYHYGVVFVDEAYRNFSYYLEGEDHDNFQFKQLTDSTWDCIYTYKNCNVTGLFVRTADSSSFSFDGYDYSEDYSMHVYSVGKIEKGTQIVQVDCYQDTLFLGWANIVVDHVDGQDFWTVTSGIEE